MSRADGAATTLSPWKHYDGNTGWLGELLEEGVSDRAPKAETPTVPMMDEDDLEDFRDEEPDQEASLQASVVIYDRLNDLLASLEKDTGDVNAVFVALENVFQ